MKTGKTSKFCAGATIGVLDVESINHASEIATTGTPAAFLAKSDGTSGSEIDFWAAFALLVACFVIVLVEDRMRG